MNKKLQTLIDGLTYSGSIKESIINYALIFFTVLPHLMAAKYQTKGNRSKWYLVLIISVFVQIVLWFFPGAVGVSIVWCSMAAFNMLILIKSEFNNKSKIKILLIVSLLLSSLGILYYAIIFPVITTAAHIIAALMGVGLFYLCKRLPIK
ncbi:MAG: hypothetical protein WKG06_27020 [Segetibacter sp.]